MKGFLDEKQDFQSNYMERIGSEKIKGKKTKIEALKNSLQQDLRPIIQQNFSKKERGITLIALVITIVILIILAVVAINAVFGDSGLLKYAQDAKNYQSNADVSDAEMINDATSYIDGIISGNGESGGNPSGGKTLVEMYDSGELKIGDYVDYKNPTSGTVTISASETGMDEGGVDGITDQTFDVSKNQLNWRVLGKDEETGGIMLIAGSPMKSNNVIEGKEVPYLYMYGAKSYINGVSILNRIGALYKNEYAQEARSVNLDDINMVTGIKTEEDIKRVNLDPIMNDGYQYGETYSYENHYTPESWLNGKQTTTVTGTVDGYYYSINSQAEGDAPYVELTDTRAYDMLFDNVEYPNGKQYWLASAGVGAPSDYAIFGPGVVIAGGGITNAGIGYMFSSDGNERDDFAGVRPVVILKSDITEEQVPKIADKTEEEWNYKIEL